MKFNKHIKIGSKIVGPDEPVLIIAEAGVAHFGDIGKALELVDLAADAGADVFKTQAFSTDLLISSQLPEWQDRLRPKEVDFKFIEKMKLRCDERNILFMCTAHDDSVSPWLDELEVPAYKVGSGERNNTPYFQSLAEKNKPIIISTGMYSEEDILEMINTFYQAGHKELALLHCVTSYPTPPDQINLPAIDKIKSIFNGPVGYSDHSEGHHVPLAAVAMGAHIIEKHITLDFNIPNAQDWKVSAGPEDLADFVKSIRDVEAAIKGGPKVAQQCEKEAQVWALKSLVAARDLPVNHVIQVDDIIAKRPGNGIPPSKQEQVLGKVIKKRIRRDEKINWENLV